MNENMNGPTPQHHNFAFAVGMAAGTVIGAGLVMWFAPRGVSALRQRVGDSAAALGKRASDQYRQATTRMAEAVDAATNSGQDARDDFADVVVRGAQEVERLATAAKSGR